MQGSEIIWGGAKVARAMEIKVETTFEQLCTAQVPYGQALRRNE